MSMMGTTGNLRELVRRGLVTLGAVLANWLLQRVPAPGLDAAALDVLLPGAAPTVGALGVSALLVAALLVELVGWALARRDPDRLQRIRRRWVHPTALAFAMVQATVVTMGVGSLEDEVGDRLVESSVLVWLSLVAGFAVRVWGCQAVTRSGIGNGVSLWVVLESVPELFSALGDEPARLARPVFFAVVVVAASRFSTRSTTDAPSMRIPPCGVQPLAIGATAMSLFDSNLVGAAFVGAAALALGRLWHPSGVGKAQLRGAVLLVGVFLAHFGEGAQATFTAAVVVALAIGVDLVTELRHRLRWGPLVTLAEEHRVDAADVLAAKLRAAGIPVLLRAAEHRAMLQWFVPAVPVEVMVPLAQQDAARALSAASAYR